MVRGHVVVLDRDILKSISLAWPGWSCFHLFDLGLDSMPQVRSVVLKMRRPLNSCLDKSRSVSLLHVDILAPHDRVVSLPVDNDHVHSCVTVVAHMHRVAVWVVVEILEVLYRMGIQLLEVWNLDMVLVTLRASLCESHPSMLLGAWV